ncbi:MAG: hypothetical protein AB7R55_20775 [Gemmatimonadales bacterium]
MAVARRRGGHDTEAIRLREEATVALYRIRAYRETDWFEREWGA